MINLYITDDLLQKDTPRVRLFCDCKWTEKAWATRDARNVAETHIRNRHGEGRIHYDGHMIVIKKEEING